MKNIRAGLRSFIDANKYSVFSLCNIVGDACYIGYALYAHEGISGYKIVGALAAFLAHALLLAHGDALDRVHAASERGWTARLIHVLRRYSLAFVDRAGLSALLGAGIVPFAFAAQSLNGLGLALSGMFHLWDVVTEAMILQCGLGVLIVIGCLSMAGKEYIVRVILPCLASTHMGAKLFFYGARGLHHLASITLIFATVTQTWLAGVSMNPFLLVASACFLTSNYTLTRMRPSPRLG